MCAFYSQRRANGCILTTVPSLLSAGADSSVAMWDLETPAGTQGQGTCHVPLTHTSRSVAPLSDNIVPADMYSGLRRPKV